MMKQMRVLKMNDNKKDYSQLRTPLDFAIWLARRIAEYDPNKPVEHKK